MATQDGLITGQDGRVRCWWPGDDEQYVAYHDTEWGRPVHDDVRLYEKLCLEGFQSGLSWITILRKRDNFRAAFAGFDPMVVSEFGASDVDRLLQDAGIIRHRGKIEAAITNASVVLEIQDQHGSLDAFVWRFAPETGTRPRSLAEVPATTPESTALAKALKAEGARFVGPTTAYAFMQSMGMVDDHIVGCEFGRAD
ncbi:MAG: DNA-3-methyladenine glycosylase I [Euzebya tangerina]|nr:DNA-3-methyladenine glycosylase I [Euzebya tangerina]